mmetsp:Transcript_58048/g.127220  ORF Transcript_58048/g.127220 Transcript_58048/m.127220 type:complete len:207 (-) Transcript_58048:184-804(-)
MHNNFCPPLLTSSLPQIGSYSSAKLRPCDLVMPAAICGVHNIATAKHKRHIFACLLQGVYNTHSQAILSVGPSYRVIYKITSCTVLFKEQKLPPILQFGGKAQPSSPGASRSALLASSSRTWATTTGLFTTVTFMIALIHLLLCHHPHPACDAHVLNGPQRHKQPVAVRLKIDSMRVLLGTRKLMVLGIDLLECLRNVEIVGRFSP